MKVSVPAHPTNVSQSPQEWDRNETGELRIESVYDDFNRLWFVQGNGLAIFCGYDRVGKAVAQGELEHQQAMVAGPFE